MAERLLERAGLEVSRTVDAYADLARVLDRDITSIVDGGAAKGTEAARLAEMFPQATIYAFEPHPKAFARLEARLKTSPRVKLFPVAISDTIGRTTLTLSAKPTQTSLLQPTDPKLVSVGTADIEVTTLEHLIETGAIAPPQLLKLDLQGAELAAMRGLGRHLAGVQAALVEVSFRARYADACLYHDVAAAFHQADLHLYRLSDVHAHHSGTWLRADALFLCRPIIDRLLSGPSPNRP